MIALATGIAGCGGGAGVGPDSSPASNQEDGSSSDASNNKDSENNITSLNPSLSGRMAAFFSGSIDSDEDQDEYTLAIRVPGTLTISTGDAGPDIRVFDADGDEIPGEEGSWIVVIDQSVLDRGPVTIRIFGGTVGDYEAVAGFVPASGTVRSIQPRPVPSTMQEGSADIVHARSEADRVRSGTTYRTLSASIERVFGDSPGVSLNTGPHVASITPQTDGGVVASFSNTQDGTLTFSKAQFQDLVWPENVLWTKNGAVQEYVDCDADTDECTENLLESINLSRSRPLNKDYFDLAYWGYSPGGSSLAYDGELVYGARTSLDNPLRELTNNATATYSGYFSGRYLIDDGVRPRYATHRHHLWGELELVADFSDLTISGEVDNLWLRSPEGYDDEGNRLPLRDFEQLPDSTSIVINRGDIAAGRYVTTWQGVDTNAANPSVTSAAGFRGSLAGDFYGPNAEETAGVFNGSRTNADGTDYVFGVFGAQTAPLQQ